MLMRIWCQFYNVYSWIFFFSVYLREFLLTLFFVCLFVFCFVNDADVMWGDEWIFFCFDGGFIEIFLNWVNLDCGLMVEGVRIGCSFWLFWSSFWLDLGDMLWWDWVIIENCISIHNFNNLWILKQSWREWVIF